MKWQNKGVAPVYNNYELAIQLVSKTNAANKFTIASDADLKKLLPGSTDVKSSIIIPGQIEAGEYEIQLAIVAPGTKKPAIQLAIAGKTQDGWYSMGTIAITD